MDPATGKLHDHDPNPLARVYACSQGHTWEEVQQAKFCWCGWRHDFS